MSVFCPGGENANGRVPLFVWPVRSKGKKRMPKNRQLLFGFCPATVSLCLGQGYFVSGKKRFRNLVIQVLAFNKLLWGEAL